MRRSSFLHLYGPYEPVAMYYTDADTVEYLRQNSVCFYRRVDPLLTLALDMHSRQTVGFRIKGFQNLFNRYFYRRCALLKPEGLMLVSIIERLVDVLADDVLDSVRTGYAEAHRIALDDKIAL